MDELKTSALQGRNESTVIKGAYTLNVGASNKAMADSEPVVTNTTK